MRTRRFAALVLACFLTGALAGTPIAQAATFAYDDWVLPSGTGNTIYPKNFNTTSEEVNTWIRVTQWSQTPREQHPVRWTAVVSVSCCHLAGG
jgi:hypothetical protein